MAAVFPQVCSLWWRPAAAVRLVACQCTAGRASPKGIHSSGVQLWGVKTGILHLCSHRRLDWLWVQFLVSSRDRREGGSEEGLRQQASVSTNACGEKAGQIFRGSASPVLVFSFFSGKICWACLHSRSL